MGTFRKSFFILYSRRPRGRLLVNQEKIGIIDPKILSYSPIVKGKLPGMEMIFVAKPKLKICVRNGAFRGKISKTTVQEVINAKLDLICSIRSCFNRYIYHRQIILNLF